MNLLLRILFAGVLVAMLGVTSWASWHCPLFGVPRAVLGHPWFLATLCDAYAGFLTFYVWVCWKETTLPVRLLWFAAIMLLGNIAMAVFVLRELFDPANGTSLPELLARRRPPQLALPAALTTVAAAVLTFA